MIHDPCSGGLDSYRRLAQRFNSTIDPADLVQRVEFLDLEALSLTTENNP